MSAMVLNSISISNYLALTECIGAPPHPPHPPAEYGRLLRHEHTHFMAPMYTGRETA
jgi:hypothetical protein